MADFRRLAFLQRVLAIQEIYQDHKHEGVLDKWIYQNFIEPVYFISEQTFRRYLGVNAKREIKEIKSKYQNQEEES